jgi:hypothetical protein
MFYELSSVPPCIPTVPTVLAGVFAMIDRVNERADNDDCSFPATDDNTSVWIRGPTSHPRMMGTKDGVTRTASYGMIAMSTVLKEIMKRDCDTGIQI